MAVGAASFLVLAAASIFLVLLLDEHFHLVLRLQLAIRSPVLPPLLEELIPEQPEELLRQQLARSTLPAESAALHSALAPMLEVAGRPEEALKHLVAARDEALSAAKSAPPPLRLGEAILWSGKEAEELAWARMQLSEAYLQHGRPRDAQECLEPQLHAIVGLEPVLVAAVQRMDAHIHSELGQHDLALHVYKFARQRLERFAGSDPVATTELARVHSGMAAVFLKMGDPTSALNAAQKAVSLLESRTALRERHEHPKLLAELRLVAGSAQRAAKGGADRQRAVEMEEAVAGLMC